MSEITKNSKQKMINLVSAVFLSFLWASFKRSNLHNIISTSVIGEVRQALLWFFPSVPNPILTAGETVLNATTTSFFIGFNS